MTTHTLARRLLAGPDVPVTIPGDGENRGVEMEVVAVEVGTASVFPVRGTTTRDASGYPPPTIRVALLPYEVIHDLPSSAGMGDA